MSASLKSFLSANSSARQSLDGVVSELPTDATLHLSYIGSTSASVARAAHSYDHAGIIVLLCADQQPLDEFIGLYFEIANSLSRKTFETLMDKAKSGTIPRETFPIEVLKAEFAAVKRTKNIISSIAISAEAQRTSYFYRRFVECPDDFDSFLAYRQRVSPERNPIDDYKLLYDELQRK